MNLRHRLLLALGLAGFASAALADVITGTATPNNAFLGATTATGLVRSPGGVGHILLLPYFNVNGGNATLLNVTNNDGQAKAVHVRIRGGSNGDTLAQFLVLMQPGGVWTATLREGFDGVAEIVTTDPGCTVPRLVPGIAQPLGTARLPAWMDPGEKARLTRQGYVEILNVADLKTPANPFAQKSPLLQTILGASPACDTAVIRTALVDTNHTTEVTAAVQGFAGPTGGLSGRWAILNVPKTTTYPGAMVALRAVDGAGADARANFVLFPPVDQPYTGPVDERTSDPTLRSSAWRVLAADGAASMPVTSPLIVAAFHDLPDLSTPYTLAPGGDAALAQAGELSRALLVRSVRFEWSTEPSIQAATDWVFSQPTLRYSFSSHRLSGDFSPSVDIRFSKVPPNGAPYFSNGGCTVSSASTFRNRQGAILSSYPPAAAPTSPVYPFGVCGPTRVVRVGQSPSAAGAVEPGLYVGLLDPGSPSGWARLDIASPGMPLLGYGFIKANNHAASPGVSGTYGLVHEFATTP